MVIPKHHLFLVLQGLDAKEERNLLFGAVSYGSLFSEGWRKTIENLVKAEEDKKCLAPHVLPFKKLQLAGRKHSKSRSQHRQAVSASALTSASRPPTPLPLPLLPLPPLIV